jgi:uncharacterized membrane protein
MILLALRAFAGRALSFLGRLNGYQIAIIALALFAGIQTLRVSAEKRHSAKVEQQLAKSITELNRLTSAKNQQHTITKTNIVTVTKRIHDAEGRAKIVETAPLPGQCRTPQEVRDADI